MIDLNNPLVSIIVPVYNVERYIEKCIDSIVGQTYKNIEIILVDDGSTDNSGEICDKYKSLDSRIKVIHKQNGGLSDARNVGLDNSAGDYIVFVDSDDYIESTMIENMFSRLINDLSDLCICGFKKVDADGAEIVQNNKLELNDEILTNKQALKSLCKGVSTPFVVACNKLYKKKLFEHIRFPKGKLHEDEFVMHYIFDQCEKVSCTSESFYNYVQHSNSITNSTFSIRRLDIVEAFFDRALFFIQKNMYEQASIALLSGIQVFSKGIEKVNRSNPELVARIELYKEKYKQVYKVLVRAEVKRIRKIKFFLFAIDYRLYICFERTVVLVKKAAGLLISFIKSIYHHLKLDRLVFVHSIRKGVAKARRRQTPIIYIVATPNHGNLGDHAIVYAEYKFLKNQFKNCKIIEISNNDFFKHKDTVVKHVKREDIVVIDGGGNLGTLWPNEDDKISEIVKYFQYNKIIIFPQTCYYDNNDDSKKRIEKNKKIYSHNPNLLITLRDFASYQFFKQNFCNVKSLYIPDIVLYIDNLDLDYERNGILLCFRKDHEKQTQPKRIEELKHYIKKNSIEFSNTDTVLPYSVSMKTREKELYKKWIEFSKSRLVITDRLHGMIFAAITNTPCIAIDNVSKKVSGVYKHISELEHIKIVEDFSLIESTLLDMYNMKTYTKKINLDFSALKKVLDKLC